MNGRVLQILAVLLVLLAWFAGVKTGERNAAHGSGELAVSSRPGTPVATFDGQSISAEELKAQIEEQTPFVRSRYTTAEGKREFLESLVRFELLAREAQKKGYQADPDVVRQHKRNMVAVFVQREFEEAQQKLPVPDAELQRYYDEHKNEYVKPERVRLATIFFEAPAADAARRTEKKAAAEAALAELKAKDPREYNAFAEVARQRTEDPNAKPVGGDLHFLAREELAQRTSPEVAETGFGIIELGALHGAVVETPKGFYLVKLLGRENALDLKLADVRETIRNRIVFEKRSQNYQQFIAGLEKQAGLKIDTAVLNGIIIDAGSPPPAAPVVPAPAVPAGAPAK